MVKFDELLNVFIDTLHKTIDEGFQAILYLLLLRGVFGQLYC